jgi:hypothetical protein
MVIFAFLTSLSLAMPISDCSGSTPVAFDVVASHGPVQEAANYTLAEISELAHRTRRSGKHAPLGFYLASFGYTVSVDVSVLSETTCSEPVHVTVTLMLFDRHIEIGKELVAEPCLFALARNHYRRHAGADDVVLLDAARAQEMALQQIPLPRLQHDAALADEDRQRLHDALTVAIDRTLASFDALSADARDKVGSFDEVKKLSSNCNSGT